MIGAKQLPSRFLEVIEEQVAIYDDGTSITEENSLPETGKIPLDNPNHWLKIPEVICVYVDMISSTKLSASNYDNKTAGAYQLFTGVAIRLFHEFEAPYIDVKGDGVFSLFNGDQAYRAIAAAVSFKTFSEEVFSKRILMDTDIEVGAHIGIDQKTVLVRKLGLRRYGDRTERQNEVWAGKPVNMAAKLASMSKAGELYVSERYFKKIQDKHVTYSCGCNYEEDGRRVEGENKYLWELKDDINEDGTFDFDKAYILKSKWCEVHGKEYCEAILKLDNGTSKS